MNHTDLITNQELLKVLERRLPNFNREELIFLGQIMTKQIPDKGEILEFLKEKYPETHNLFQKANHEEKQTSIKVTIYRCQECRELILIGADEKHENICSKCLENKKNN